MQTKRTSQGLLCLCLAAAELVGCHHAGFRKERAHEGDLPSITAEELFHVGLLHARRGDLLRAEQYLNAARYQGHDEPAVVYWLVRVCVSAGRYRSALGHAASYLRDHPANWELRLVVASIHEALGDFERAQIELESIVADEPVRPLPHYRLATLYRERSTAGWRAQPHLEAYLELAPNGPHAAEVGAALEDGLADRPAPAAIGDSNVDQTDAQGIP